MGVKDPWFQFSKKKTVYKYILISPSHNISLKLSVFLHILNLNQCVFISQCLLHCDDETLCDLYHVICLENPYKAKKDRFKTSLVPIFHHTGYKYHFVNIPIVFFIPQCLTCCGYDISDPYFPRVFCWVSSGYACLFISCVSTPQLYNL